MKNVWNRHVLAALAGALSVLFFVTSCEDDLPLESSVKESTAQITPDIQRKIDFIRSTGFEEDSIIYRNGDFFVDGDMSISEKDVSRRMQKQEGQGSRTEQRRYEYIVDSEKVEDIKVAFQVGTIYQGTEAQYAVSSDWKTAFTEAFNAWNSVSGSTVHFYEVDYNSADYDVRICAVNSGVIPAVAAADLPLSSEVAGPRVRVNYGYNHISSDAKLNAAIHELGHTIGLAHTDKEYTDNNGNVLDTHISGTAGFGQDSESIMNWQFNAYNPTMVLSTNDEKAVQILYPAPCTLIEVPSEAPLGGYVTINWQQHPRATCDEFPASVDLVLYKDGSYIKRFAYRQTSGSYRWRVYGGKSWKTQMEVDGYQIKVIDSYSREEIEGASNRFTIYRPLFKPNGDHFNQAITSPKLGDKYGDYNIITATWNKDFFPSNKVRLSIYYVGEEYQSIGETDNDGSHSFRLPRFGKTNIGFQIYVQDSNNSYIDDVTHPFTIIGFDE